MASTLSLSKAAVTSESGTLDGSVTIRFNRALVRRNMTVIADKDGVLAVERHGTALEWTISFADGSTWEIVAKKGGCGCR